MTPKDLVQEWVRLFNNADAQGLAELYHLDAVNHQITKDPVMGKDAILEMFTEEFNTANMTCIIESIYEDGNCAILEWKDPLGLRGCGFFTIENDLIAFQRGYWDRLSFLRLHNLPIPKA